MQNSARKWVIGIGLLTTLLLLSGCGSRVAEAGELAGAAAVPARAGGAVGFGEGEPAVWQLRKLAGEEWRRPALSYSGFRHGQSPRDGRYPVAEEILEDLLLMAARGYGLIRVFSSGRHGREVIELIAATGLDIKVQLGAYLSGAEAEHGEANWRELRGAVELALRYPEVVIGVSVGNEVLVDWSFVPVPVGELVGYIRYVRERIQQPVTVNDNWEPYAVGPEDPRLAVWREIDYASVHTYAYWDAGFRLWDFKQRGVEPAQRAVATVAAAAAYARKNFAAVRAALDAAGLAIPIVIGETGWQSVPSAYLDEAQVKDFANHLGHPVNQALYYRAMMDWTFGSTGNVPGDGFARPLAMFYFAAFDEPWKEADDNWGLWDALRQEKFVLSGKGYTLEDAVKFMEQEDLP